MIILIYLGSSDFKMIHSEKSIITMDEYNLLHEEHIKFLQQEIERAKDENKKLVVFSHHKPTLKRYMQKLS